LFDTAISILRRFLRRQPIFSADRDHIHHRLLDRGFSTPRLVGGLQGVAAVLAIFALIETTAGPVVRTGALVLYVVGLYLAIQYLRYREFGLAVNALRHNGVRAAVRSHLTLGRCEEALSNADTAEQCWEAVLAASRELGFSDTVLCIGGRTYRENGAHRAGTHWTLMVPLNGSDYLRFMCPFGWPKTPAIIAPLADSLHRVLSSKAQQFAPPADEFRLRTAEFIRKRRLRTQAIAAMAAISDSTSDPVIHRNPK
jgi:UDP-GlcNAc:undecaprenyl-phosphate GlcNAc-1-phosphate transferase